MASPRSCALAAVVLASFGNAASGCSCGGAPETAAPSMPESPRDASGAEPEWDAGRRASADASSPGRYASLLTDAELMAALEERGLAFAERVPGGKKGGEGSLAALSRETAFGRVAEVLAEDLEALEAEDPRAGVGMGNAHRLFDPAWLRSPDTRFELVGVVSRLDRRPFVEGACGELRLVYRLAYSLEVGDRTLRSRLPMTVALDWLEDPPRGEGCREVAARWREPLGVGAGQRLPVSADRLGEDRFHRFQVNVQSVRFPSAVHPSLGGHAEYILRSFEPGPEGQLEPAPLENSPDVPALERDPEARAELLAWIRDPKTRRRIDAGRAKMPAEFAADRAVSSAPRGLARIGNRPFAQLFSEDDFADLEFSELSNVRSPAGLLRRLDDHSCAGCHQGRAVAGFHLLGEDRPGTAKGNALALALSPHGRSEARRRSRLLAAEARDGEPASYARPFSERDARGPGVYGAPCGRTEDATFSDWDCAAGLECKAYDTSSAAPHVGACFPKAPQVGDPCEVGALRTRSESRADRIRSAERWSCASGAVCNENRVGFPGGLCTTTCEAPGGAGRCGAIALLEPFNACIARNEAFDACLAEHVRPAGLRACDAGHPCRNDYICAENGQGKGVCIPPYFLFQMRVDGHPERLSEPGRATPR